jgi:ergothioneine biosynthesis protein EgtB
LLTRPSLAEVLAYRAHVDRHVLEVFAKQHADAVAVIELGLHHEQQHQELLLTDAKHLLAASPLRSAYRSDLVRAQSQAEPLPLRWHRFETAIRELGSDGPHFHFDNETPRHPALAPAFAIASRLVTNGEFLVFVESGAYADPACWLSDGFATLRSEGWQAPGYWEIRDGAWHEFTLGGLRPLDLAAPVSHVSFYEADAFARWSDARLPSEAEWEIAATGAAVAGNFVENGALHPVPLFEEARDVPSQLFGDVWEWTQSPYLAYPGFRPAAGEIGEYNGKFMCNQFVLRGGSCATPRDHVRATYRNFFPPAARWQWSGLRLARDTR